jgi:hypothetical protein
MQYDPQFGYQRCTQQSYYIFKLSKNNALSVGGYYDFESWPHNNFHLPTFHHTPSTSPLDTAMPVKREAVSPAEDDAREYKHHRS